MKNFFSNTFSKIKDLFDEMNKDFKDLDKDIKEAISESENLPIKKMSSSRTVKIWIKGNKKYTLIIEEN